MATLFKQFFTIAFISLLACFAAGATDYVEEINTSSSTRGVGKRVIYEMNVGSFTQAGTFAEAAKRLPELKALGVDVVWLMPIYPRGTSGSPYAATNFQKTNPKYGTIANLKAMVAAAHELGMEVWLDWVPNHTATNAEWVTTHPEYYAKSGGQMIHPNNYDDVWQLDYNNSGLVEAMNDCLKFWIDQCDIDGYRCDYISSSRIPTSYWVSTIPMIKSYKEGKNISFLGEADIATNATRLKNAGFDYDYAWQLHNQLVSFGANGTSATTLKNNANNLFNVSQNLSFGRMLYLTNHDQNFNDGGKTLTKMFGDNRYLLTVFAYTIYGMPLIYNGQEVGGNQILDYFSDTKINWGGKDAKMFNTVRTLTALKHSQEALTDYTTGSLNPKATWLTTGSTNVLAYTREQGDNKIMVVLNLSKNDVNLTITDLDAGSWSEWLNSKTISKGVSRTQYEFGTSATFSLEGKGYRVFVKGVFPEETIEEEEPLTDLTDDSDCAVFYECPDEATICVWLWSSSKSKYTTADWPGDALTRLGVTASGNVVYKYEVNLAPGEAMPTNLIFTKNGSSDSNKTFDGKFVNHGYYIEGQGEATIIIPAAITDVVNDARHGDETIYDIHGRVLPTVPEQGLYIQNGKKYIAR
jgi:glycosidase